MPHSLKLQETYGDDLQVLFVSSGDDLPKVESFGLKKKWINERAMWSKEAPFQTGSNTIPHCILLGNDGEVLFNGKPTSKVEELIDEQIRIAKKGPKGVAPALAKACVDFEKGGYVAAIQSLEAVQDGPDKEAAGELAKTLAKRLDVKVARLSGLIDSGKFERADKLAAALVKGVAGDEARQTKVNALAGKLASQELAPEREAAKALDKVYARIAKDGLDEKTSPQLAKALNGVKEKYPNTASAKRAEHLAELFQ